MLMKHPWPGNVRELRNVLDQTVLLTRERVIPAESLAIYAARSTQDVAMPSQGSDQTASLGGGTLLEVERKIVLETLEKTDWNVSKAARVLGLSRDMLRTRMEKYGLSRAEK
jgi:DNA-binding NtrC family response regulator